MLILVPSMCLAAAAHHYLQIYSPSDAIVARVRRARPRIQVAGLLLVLSAAIAFGARILADWAASGGPSWLNLLVLIAIWDCFKFLFLALASALSTVRKVGASGPTRPT